MRRSGPTVYVLLTHYFFLYCFVIVYCHFLVLMFCLDLTAKYFLSVTTSDDMTGISSRGRRRKLSITAPEALRRCYMTNTVYLTLTLDYMWITARCHPIGQCHGSHHSLQEASHHTGNTKKNLKIPTR